MSNITLKVHKFNCQTHDNFIQLHCLEDIIIL